MLVCQGDTQGSGVDFQDAVLYDMAKFLIYDRIGEKKEEGEGYKKLQEKLKAGINRPMHGKPTSSYQNVVYGQTYYLPEEDNENYMGWKWFRFDVDGDEGTLTYENRRGEKQIKFGVGKFVQSTFPETYYYGEKCNEPSNREMACEAVLEWVEEQKILLRTHIIDTSFGNFFAQFSFKGEEVTIIFQPRAEFFLNDYNGCAWAKPMKK